MYVVLDIKCLLCSILIYAELDINACSAWYLCMLFLLLMYAVLGINDCFVEY